MCQILYSVSTAERVYVPVKLTCEELVLYVQKVFGPPDGMHVHTVQPCINQDPLAAPQTLPQHSLWILLIDLEVGGARVHGPEQRLSCHVYETPHLPHRRVPGRQQHFSRY